MVYFFSVYVSRFFVVVSFFTLAPNVEAFVFVAEFEIRLLGTNAVVMYKSSLLIQLLN